MISVSKYGRKDGALYAATVWYEETTDPDGVKVPGRKGRWRVAASTTLPEGAKPVSEAKALAEIHAIQAQHETAVADALKEAEDAAAKAAGELVTAGVSPEIAARLAARLGA